MNKLLALIALIGLSFASVGTANAALIRNVSDDSEAFFEFFSLFDTKIDINQDAHIDNNVKAFANSGHNKIKSDKEQEGTILTTGSAEAGAFVNNTANVVDIKENIAMPDFGGFSGNGDHDGNDKNKHNDDNNKNNGVGGIENIHDDSKAKVEIKDIVDNNIKLRQDVRADNDDVLSSSNTGDNEIESDDELEDTIVTTGPAKATSAVENAFNLINIVKNRYIR